MSSFAMVHSGIAVHVALQWAFLPGTAIASPPSAHDDGDEACALQLNAVEAGGLLHGGSGGGESNSGSNGPSGGSKPNGESHGGSGGGESNGGSNGPSGGSKPNGESHGGSGGGESNGGSNGPSGGSKPNGESHGGSGGGESNGGSHGPSGGGKPGASSWTLYEGWNCYPYGHGAEVSDPQGWVSGYPQCEAKCYGYDGLVLDQMQTTCWCIKGIDLSKCVSPAVTQGAYSTYVH